MAISSPQQRRFADVCSTSSRFPLVLSLSKDAPNDDVCSIKVGAHDYAALIDTTPVGLYHEYVVVLHGELAVPYTLNPP